MPRYFGQAFDYDGKYVRKLYFYCRPPHGGVWCSFSDSIIPTVP